MTTARPPTLRGGRSPHVGTDLLRGVIRSIRGEIEVLGGEVRFNMALTGLHTRNGALTGIETEAGPVPCEQMILAVGHSARDTFASCTAWASPAGMPFAVGFRARAPDVEIDKSLSRRGGSLALPKGEYQLSQHRLRRAVRLPFCMCPGGAVAPPPARWAALSPTA